MVLKKTRGGLEAPVFATQMDAKAQIWPNYNNAQQGRPKIRSLVAGRPADQPESLCRFATARAIKRRRRHRCSLVSFSKGRHYEQYKTSICHRLFNRDFEVDEIICRYMHCRQHVESTMCEKSYFVNEGISAMGGEFKLNSIFEN